jgi:hypothetical protein
MSLDIKKYCSEIRQQYKDNPASKSLNILLLGESGSGKTFLMRTAPKPVFIDSFDRGGSKCLQPWIDKGDVIVDSRWEDEDPYRPSAFDTWARETAMRSQEGFFDYLGTYMLDSSTTWSSAIMNHVLKKAGRAGESPQWSHDYAPQKMIVQNWTTRLLNMPCNFVLTGHLQTIKDELIGKVTQRFMAPGQAAVYLPLLFDEIWVMEPKENSKGVDYKILLSSTGFNLARSRLCQDGKLDKYEKPNLNDILTKAKWPIRTPKKLEE